MNTRCTFLIKTLTASPSPASPIQLNGGTIKDSDGNDAHLSYAGSADFGSHMVQGTDTTAPTILRMEISSTPPSADTYTQDENIEVAVFFSEEVDPTGSSVDIEVGDNTRTATYNRKSGATAWYQYTVVAADEDTNGISIDANSVTAGSNNLADSAGNAADLTHAAIGDDARHRVEGTDTTAPTIHSISITSTANNGPYKVGETVEFTVLWREAVYTSSDGRPSLTFVMNDNEVKTAEFSQANLDSDHDKSKLVFEYTVVAGDMARKLGVPANAVQLTNSEAITDRADNDADLTSGAVNEFPRQHIFGMGGL